jgi:post-segregation antitoxin (ccd killing protein)
MGRANVYLPDDLERRVKAARIPVSEVCQQALLAAVEAAEAERPRLGEAVGDLYARGEEAGERWARAASTITLLALVRDQRLEQIPPDCLPESSYSLSDELTTAWEAGFVEAARAVARAAVNSVSASPGRSAANAMPSTSDSDVAAGRGSGDDTPDVAGGTTERVGTASAGSVSGLIGRPGQQSDGAGDGLPGDEPADTPKLGDGSTSYIGVDHAGRRIAFDPHAAVAEDKSPLFAVLGPADQRAQLALSIGQDAACRGVAVVLVDLSGQLAPRARGLGKIVRIPNAGQPSSPSLESMLGSLLGAQGGMESGMRGMWDLLSGLSAAGGGLFPTPGGSSRELVTPGYVTVLTVSGDGPLGGVMGAMNALRALAELTAKAAHPRLLLVDLPTGVAVPGQLAAAVGRLVRTARQNDVALGLSAESADAVADVGGSGALLSTVFAFPTSSPIEADRLRDLLGAHAPILLNPPGFLPRAEDEIWTTMRDLAGRLGQVRLDAT